MATKTMDPFVQAARLADVRGKGSISAQVDGHPIVLFLYGEQVYAVDNRCPHMGFPLDRGTVRDGILTCHWHHARFDLASGGTFDLFADDVRVFPVEIRDGQVWVDVSTPRDLVGHQRDRLRDGLERNITLVIAKAVLSLLENGISPVEPFKIGVDFGTKYRQPGWGQGLTILACMMNLLPYLAAEDRPRALYHGLSAVADDSDSMAPRFMVRPLPQSASSANIPTLKRWLRQFIEVRDAEGAERCVISAIRAGADDQQMADMLFAAATDHRYIQIGHPLDFTNKAFETLDIIGWDSAEQVLSSLVGNYARADRMEESNAWRNPIDVVALLEAAFEVLPQAVEAGTGKHWQGRDALAATLLEDDPQASIEALLAALRDGCRPEILAEAVAYAAALRIAQFHTSNDFGDWDTALHTFTFANAVHQGLRRVESLDLLRGVFDAAMSVYLDRFLNIPAARLPARDGKSGSLSELNDLLSRQQQVNQAGQTVARYLYGDGQPETLLATLGRLLLRENRNFHTIQSVEAAFRQYELLKGRPEATHVLVAAARYLAAHSPTTRSQGQEFQVAYRLGRGERLFEDD